MVYVGKGPIVGYYDGGDRSRPYIDPALPVAKVGSDKQGDGLTYWPGYSRLSATCRATYLDWLAGGRSDPAVNVGYMFIYFYGLERRFIVDNPSEIEKREVLEEVRRLKALFADNGSVQRYLGDFIDLASLMLDEAELKKPIYKNWGWDLPLSLKVTLGGAIANDLPIGADWVLSWFLCHNEKRLRTPAHRCEDEFMALFRLKFAVRYPNELKVTKPRKHLKYSYRSASGEFGGEIPITANGKPILDISGARKPVEIGQEIADEAMDELDKFSRYLGRNPAGRGSLEAQALLPASLWDTFPSEELKALKVWVRACIDNGGLTGVVELIAKLEGDAPAKITKRQLIDAADALARMGFGLAPDPRFALRAPRESEQIVLFDLGQTVEQLEDVSEAYRRALLEQTLATFIAYADGRLMEEEKEVLQRRTTDVVGLSEVERRRLLANQKWLFVVPPDMALMRSRLKEVTADQQAILRTAMVSIAHADGMIQPQEVVSIEKIYAILGIDPKLVYSDLHANRITDLPVMVKAAEPSPAGEAIPKEERKAGPRLDAARIAAIKSDTERVSTVLGQIFAGEQDNSSEEPLRTSPIPGLDAKHAALVRQVIEQDHWNTEAFAALAAGHGLMVSGALEAINEWSFANYDQALLDEYDGYDVTGEIAHILKSEMQKEAA